MKTLIVEKDDILKEFENKLNLLPIICYSEHVHDFYILVDDDFDEKLLGVKCRDIYDGMVKRRRKIKSPKKTDKISKKVARHVIKRKNI